MIELGLHRISCLLDKTALPWRAIHVAGTNGKGSVCAYVSGMLDAYNKSTWRSRTGSLPVKHARLTSPHLVDRWDCITMNQQAVACHAFDEVEERVIARNRKDGIKASEFELLTATAFEIFTQDRVDVGVIEVGMGGRLDATNVLGEPGPLSSLSDVEASTFRAPPLVTAIAKIGLDHQGFLGNKLEDIAREKAGIIKPGVPLVYDSSNAPSVKEVFATYASEAHTKALSLEDLSLPIQHINSIQLLRALPLSELPEAAGFCDAMENLGAEASASHTKHNASVAVRATWIALQQLSRVPTAISGMSGEELSDLATLAIEMLKVPSRTIFPGRLQKISIERLTGREESIMLDGAHNAQSAEVLGLAVKNLQHMSTREGKPSEVTWVVAASDTKDVKEIFSPLLKPGDRVFAVEFGPVDGMPWVKPMGSGDLVEAAKFAVGLNDTSSLKACGSDILYALRSASDRAAGGPLVVAGSLYLVSDVLRLLRNSEGQLGR